MGRDWEHLEVLPPVFEQRLERLAAHRVDGRLDEAAWELADDLFLRRELRRYRGHPDELSLANTYLARSQAARAHAGGTSGPLVFGAEGRSRRERAVADFWDGALGQLCAVLLALPRVRRYR